MMRGMFSAISGLKNHQLMLDVTANDIANVNTTGYKSARTTFKDSLTQLQRGAAVTHRGKREARAGRQTVHRGQPRPALRACSGGGARLRRAGQATARRFAWPHIVQRILLPRLHHVAETSYSQHQQPHRTTLR